MPQFLNSFLRDFRGGNRYRRAKLHLIKDDLERYVYLRNGITRGEKRNVLSEGFLKEFNDYDDYWYFNKYWRADVDVFTRLQYLDMKTFLVDDVLRKVDQMSMLHSLEVRVPILDHRLVEFAFDIHPDIRNKNGALKYAFKKSLVGIIPEEILRRGKRGFSIPMSYWLDKLGSMENFPEDLIRADSVYTATMNNPGREYQFRVLNLWFNSRQ